MKIKLVTTSRQDLFDISEALARAIHPSRYEDKENPVVVDVRGSMNSGKKIISDGMRDALLGSTAMSGFNGEKDYDEFWRGQVAGRPFELSYIDVLYKDGYNTPSLNTTTNENARVASMIERRQFGGISVLQNREIQPSSKSRNEVARAMGSIEVWVETSRIHMARWEEERFSRVYKKENLAHIFWAANGAIKKGKRMEGPSIFDKLKDRLWRQFNKASDLVRPDRTWARYVEISVFDKELLSSSRFVAAMRDLSDAARAVNDMLLKSGFKLPRVAPRPYRAKQGA